MATLASTCLEYVSLSFLNGTASWIMMADPKTKARCPLFETRHYPMYYPKFLKNCMKPTSVLYSKLQDILTSLIINFKPFAISLLSLANEAVHHTLVKEFYGHYKRKRMTLITAALILFLKKKTCIA